MMVIDIWQVLFLYYFILMNVGKLHNRTSWVVGCHVLYVFWKFPVVQNDTNSTTVYAPLNFLPRFITMCCIYHTAYGICHTSHIYIQWIQQLLSTCRISSRFKRKTSKRFLNIELPFCQDCCGSRKVSLVGLHYEPSTGLACRPCWRFMVQADVPKR